jgi:hypothetical protein
VRRWSRRQRATLFQGFWHGPPLGVFRQACLRSFVELGHRFHLYAYERVDVPAGVEVRDANEVIPFDEIFYHWNPLTGREDLGPFSDLFRFRLFQMRGGWWTDIDAVCLSSQIPEVESAWAREFPEFRPEDVGTSQLALGKGSELARALYEDCLALSRSGIERRESLGPILLTRTISERGLHRDNFGDTDRFYPLRYIEAFKLWLPDFAEEISRKTANAMFLPLYQSVAQSQGVDLACPPPEGSYLDRLSSRLAIRNDSAARQDAAAVVSRARDFFIEHDWAVDAMRAVADGDSALATLGVR